MYESLIFPSVELLEISNPLEPLIAKPVGDQVATIVPALLILPVTGVFKKLYLIGISISQCIVSRTWKFGLNRLHLM